MNTIKLIAASAGSTRASGQNLLKLANDAEIADQTLDGVDAVELHFPKFTDGRAYSQATALRRRAGFTGDICATGDVLVDQLVQMQRCGFTSAVLREDQSLEIAQAQFAQYSGFYQRDPALTPSPAGGRSNYRLHK